MSEPEPDIGVEIAGLLEAMPQQIHDDDSPARLQDARAFTNRLVRMQRVMQALMKESDVHRGVLERQFLEVADAVLEILRRRAGGRRRARTRPSARELSTAITRSARCASISDTVPSPAPMSAMTSGGSRRSNISAIPFQLRPGT